MSFQTNPQEIKDQREHYFRLCQQQRKTIRDLWRPIVSGLLLTIGEQTWGENR